MSGRGGGSEDGSCGLWEGVPPRHTRTCSGRPDGPGSRHVPQQTLPQSPPPVHDLSGTLQVNVTQWAEGPGEERENRNREEFRVDLKDLYPPPTYDSLTCLCTFTLRTPVVKESVGLWRTKS